MNQLFVDPGPIEAAFADDPLARAFADLGDLQVACMTLEARRRRAAALARVWIEAGSRSGWWLRMALAHGIAYCHEGRILVGPPDAPPEACTPVNAHSRSLLVDKPATKMVLEIMGFPSPAGREFAPDQHEEAMAYALSRGRPVCVKTARGSLGIRVYPHLTAADDIRRALEAAGEPRRTILVEDHLAGQAARFIFVKPIVVGARLDLPANVVGDGRSTVAELVAAKNRAKRLRTGHAPVVLGEREIRELARQGLRESDIPEAGSRVFLRQLSNLYQGGDSRTWSGPICDTYAAEIARLCNGIPGLQIAAIDTIIADASRPAAPDGWGVIELNAAPGVVAFHFPWEGEPQDMVAIIMDWLLTGEAWRDA